MGWPTAQAVVQQAALELGLIQSLAELGADVYQVGDSNLVQLVTLLNKAGMDLVDEAPWTQLRAEFSITTVTGVFGGADTRQRIGVYALPPNWRSLVAQTGWNRTTRLPLGGALSEQEWQFLSSRLAGVTWTILFKPAQGLLWLYPSTSTPAGQAITFAYKSSYWARPASLVEGTDYGVWAALANYKAGAMVAGGSAGEPFSTNIYRCVQPGKSGAVGADPALVTTGVPTLSGSILDGTAYWNWVGVITSTVDPLGTTNIETPSFGTLDTPVAGSNVLLFDKALLVAKLKLAWKREKGFDTTDVEREYARVFTAVGSNDAAPPILSLNRGGVSDRLLGELNTPITGFGS